MALQFLLAQAQRQRLREQHQLWIQEELKHLDQEEAGDEAKGLVAGEEVRRVMSGTLTPSGWVRHCAGVLRSSVRLGHTFSPGPHSSVGGR